MVSTQLKNIRQIGSFPQGSGWKWSLIQSFSRSKSWLATLEIYPLPKCPGLSRHPGGFQSSSWWVSVVILVGDEINLSPLKTKHDKLENPAMNEDVLPIKNEEIFQCYVREKNKTPGDSISWPNFIYGWRSFNLWKRSLTVTIPKSRDHNPQEGQQQNCQAHLFSSPWKKPMPWALLSPNAHDPFDPNLEATVSREQTHQLGVRGVPHCC